MNKKLMIINNSPYLIEINVTVSLPFHCDYVKEELSAATNELPCADGLQLAKGSVG